MYDAIDLERVIAAVEPALALYQAYDDWLTARLGLPGGRARSPSP